MGRGNIGIWGGPDLSGDPLNLDYAQALVLGTGGVDSPKDCGHLTCGLLCDPYLRAVRARRAGR